MMMMKIIKTVDPASVKKMENMFADDDNENG